MRHPASWFSSYPRTPGGNAPHFDRKGLSRTDFRDDDEDGDDEDDDGNEDGDDDDDGVVLYDDDDIVEVVVIVVVVVMVECIPLRQEGLQPHRLQRSSSRSWW